MKCQKTVMSNNSLFQLLYSQAAQLFECQKYEEAIEKYLAAMAHDENNLDLLVDLGSAYLEAGKIEDARASFLKALNIDPDNALIFYKMGNVCRKEGSLDKAKVCYLKAIEIDQNLSIAYKALGNIHQKNNDLQEAINYYSRAIEIDNNYIDAINDLGVSFLLVGNAELATKCFNIIKEKSLSNDQEYCFENNEYENLHKQDTSNFRIREFHNKRGIDLVRTIYIGLSNICNYSHIHEKCPLHNQKEKMILPSHLVYKLIDELDDINYQGLIAFHLYNEPLADRRLFDFISYVKSKEKSLKIFILTNGYYLDQELADKLYDYGIYKLEVSAYTREEYERLKKLNVKVPYRVSCQELDSRLNIYDSVITNIKVPCYLPLTDIAINCNGDIILCCLDWKGEYVFGSLVHDSLLAVLDKRERSEIYKKLSRGERIFPICRRCTFISQ